MHKVRLIDNLQINDDRGNLSFWETNNHIPFDLNRVYWISDVPSGQYRGEHAFRKQQEVIIALSGSFDVHLDDGKTKKVFTLNRANKGLYVPNMIWRSLQNFSTNSVCLVLASTHFRDSDYIRSYDEFIKSRQL